MVDCSIIIARSELSNVEIAQSFPITEFDNMNRRKKIEREDGTRWAYGYNSKGEVTSGLREKTALPNAPVPGWQHAYTFDQIGNRDTTTINGRTSTYTPNALSQYDSRTVPRAFDVIGKANAAASVTIDGNPATRLDEFFYKELAAGSGAIHTPYVVQATDANGSTNRSGGKFLPATPENFTYDFDGNLTSDGRFTCTWDAENRLVSMETHATVPLAARRKLAFSYDSMGRHIRKSVWHGITGGGWQLHHHFDFIHELNGWNILAERSGGSANGFIRTYAWGTDLSDTLTGAGGVGGLLFATLHTSGKTFAYGSDLNGNVTLLVDTASGQAAATYDYGPFGEPLRLSGEYATLNPYRFSTKYTDDETGFLDYGLRYYDPSTGRWRSRDPIREKGGINLNAFVNNNAVSTIDLFGLARYEYDNQAFHVHAKKDGCKLTYTVKFNDEGNPTFAAKKGHEREFNHAKSQEHFEAAVSRKEELGKMRNEVASRWTKAGDKPAVEQVGRGLRKFRNAISKAGKYVPAAMFIAVPFAVDEARGGIVEYANAVADNNRAKCDELSVSLAEVIPEDGLRTLFYMKLQEVTDTAFQGKALPYDEDGE